MSYESEKTIQADEDPGPGTEPLTAESLYQRWGQTDEQRATAAGTHRFLTAAVDAVARAIDQTAEWALGTDQTRASPYQNKIPIIHEGHRFIITVSPDW